MKIEAHILIVDDDEDVLHTARLILKSDFKYIHTLSDPKEIPNVLSNYIIDVVILDMNFSFGQTSGEEGLFWLRKIKEINSDIHVLLNTAYGDIQLAVDGMKEGATDFLVKPWAKEKLTASVKAVYELHRVKLENKNLKEIKRVVNSTVNKQFKDIISRSKSMKVVFEMINKVAKTDANVLILGENGTGKELIARAIHKNSNRSEEEFMSVDLGAIPESLFESELFGYKKGAFTDAKEDRIGRFEMAKNGTLFLDEIGNLSLQMQVKLLSVIQNRELYRLGSNIAIPINIRLICATNTPIYHLATKDEFRQDLLYRINTVEINLPPLRSRTDDIPLLVNHFHEGYKKKYKKLNQKFSTSAMKKMILYQWPGNVRELQHYVERSVILNADELINKESIILEIDTQTEKSKTEELNFLVVEKDVIKKALKESKGNLSKAAEILGWGRSTLYRKIKKHEL